MKNNSFADCENCSHYVIDGEQNEYFCDAALDEDDVAKMMSFGGYKCPYFDFYDEYKIVRKQN